MSDNDIQAAVSLELKQLHTEVSSRARKLAAQLDERLVCRLGCTDCCVDGMTVFEIEAEQIRRNHQGLLRSAAPRQPGACAFLDAEGSCRIYPDRPYVCRTQGLPLRWFDADSSGRTVEYRDICGLNERGMPLESMDAEDCWLIGPYEGRLAALQQRSDGEMRRVSLRSLFCRQNSEPGDIV